MHRSFPYTLEASSFPHSISMFEIIETHISWIVLTGEYVYKIKKAVHFDFLDYSSLQQRHHFCLEELRLNRRLAPKLYLDVVPILGSYDNPQWSGDGEVVEYAVKMKQFDPTTQLDRIEINAKEIVQLADQIVSFHAHIEQASGAYGTPERLYQPMLNNFNYLHKLQDVDIESVQAIEEWTQQCYKRLYEELLRRKAKGYIRECHGDMHLANMVLIEDRVTIFDGIEFNETLRWIDTFSELAFILMDLEFRGYRAYATLLRNLYVELSGDYEGLRVLRFYQTYRAMVRAKIAAIEIVQGASQNAYERLNRYLDLAYDYTQEPKPFLMITFGFSGSGKSTFVIALVEHIDAVVLRSDSERKRLLAQDLYTQEHRDAIYRHLQGLVSITLESGYNTIVDATFLSQNNREAFYTVAQSLGLSFVILACQSKIEVCKERIAKRPKDDPSDATLEVVDRQLEHYDALSKDEEEFVICVENCSLDSVERVVERLGSLVS